MKYKPYVLLQDGWKMELGNGFDEHDTALQCARRRLYEVKSGDMSIVIIGNNASDDQWRKMYRNWWKYRLVRAFLGKKVGNKFINNSISK